MKFTSMMKAEYELDGKKYYSRRAYEDAKKKKESQGIPGPNEGFQQSLERCKGTFGKDFSKYANEAKYTLVLPKVFGSRYITVENRSPHPLSINGEMLASSESKTFESPTKPLPGIIDRACFNKIMNKAYKSIMSDYEINNGSVYNKWSTDEEGNVLVTPIRKKDMLMPANPGFSDDAWEWLQNQDNWHDESSWAAQDERGYCGFYRVEPTYMMGIIHTWTGAYVSRSDKGFTPIGAPVKISRKEMFNEV